METYLVEETSHMRSGEEEVEEEEEEEEDDDDDDGDEEKDDSYIDESAVQKQQRAAWAPCFFHILDKEVYYYVGHQIIIKEAFDSYGGTVWPAAPALSRYLESHSEQLSLVDKAVLELGAGVGLVSIVAALLGAWVTATDLSDVLNNLRVNLSRNTRGRCRHTPQVATLSWGYDLKDTYPTSVYRYDYVLASDVVYHHDFLDELLATMKHFCQPGTTLIWANKIRMESDMRFTENFKKAFHSSLLLDDGALKIYMATCKEEEAVGDVGLEIQDPLREEKDEDDKKKKKREKDGDEGEDEKEYCGDKPIANKDVAEEAGLEKSRGQEDSEEDETGDEDDKDDEMDEPDSVGDGSVSGQVQIQQTAAQPNRVLDWRSGVFSAFGKDIYHYVGQDIVIRESIDSFGAVMWPAALALCSFLDNNRQRVNLKDKEVLELGAGTGLVSIVASLLGAAVTATDLPDVLGNLRANVMRNTRGLCRHTPKVEVLSWGYDVKDTHPTSVYCYDYVLAADVVYHHDFLDELLVTMRHFCQPGTTVIWANKIRMVTDETFVENFKKAFHTSLLVSDGDMKIFMGTCREEEEEEEEEDEGDSEDEEKEKQNDAGPEEENDEDRQQYCRDKVIETSDVAEEACVEGDEGQEESEDDETRDEDDEEDETNKPNSIGSCCKTTTGDDNTTGQVQIQQTAAQPNRVLDWRSGGFSAFGKDIYHYVGQDIVIRESIDSFGAVMWPAALALCSFLDNNRQRVNLKDKEVLELGAGTGLVSIVASLLGAAVTSTDLPDVLGNLRANVMRNTRGRCKHTPQMEVLSWGYDLKDTHPTSVYRYDYVLAADVVYHHDFLDELLVTMRHFCQPGTTVIWANKIRMVTDETFVENFKKAFHTSLLVSDGDMKIFMGTCREEEEQEDEVEGEDEEKEKQNDAGPKEENDEDRQQYCRDKVIEK